MSTKRNRLLKNALRAAKKGWRVFPLNGKEPYGGTRGHLDATTDRTQIKQWWRKWPEANIGVACDSKNGPIVVDLDEPDASKKELPATKYLDRRNVPTTLEAESRQGRRHLYFGPPKSGARIKRKIRPFKNSKGRKYALDILGDGGYVVLTPSVHPVTEKPYRWLNEGAALRPFPRSLERALTNGNGKHVAADPLPDVIAEGQRDDTLTSLAGTMRRRGISPEAILEALRVENAKRVRPPLSDKQLQKIAYSIGKKAPVPVDLSEPITDLSLAARLAATQHKRLRYVPKWKKWLLWTPTGDGGYWQTDDGHEVDRLVEEMVQNYLRVLANTSMQERQLIDSRLRDLRKYLNHHKLTDVQLRARTQRVFETSVKALNGNPYLFNAANGTLEFFERKADVRFRKAYRRDLLTKQANAAYDPNAKCPRWDQFLKEITKGDEQLIAYLQRAVGYTMLGLTTEHVFFFCYGGGRNGKSTFLETLGLLFGDYTATIASDTLLHKPGNSGEQRANLVRLYQARFVSANETPKNARWNDALIKQLTGGDTIDARKLYEEQFSFEPTHTLWCRGNAKPKSHDSSVGFWRRIKLIPFTQQFKEGDANYDPNLKTRLCIELPGILNWAIKGCIDWHKHGLGEPPSVRDASREYREEENVFGEFVDACCVLGKGETATSTELYQAFTSWWADTRGPKSTYMSQHEFLGELKSQEGLTKRRRNRGMVWRGISLRE